MCQTKSLQVTSLLETSAGEPLSAELRPRFIEHLCLMFLLFLSFRSIYPANVEGLMMDVDISPSDRYVPVSVMTDPKMLLTYLSLHFYQVCWRLHQQQSDHHSGHPDQ